MEFHYNTSDGQVVVDDSDEEYEKLPVICLCTQHCVCGCDENHNEAYTQALYSNATEISAGSDDLFLIAASDIDGMKVMVVNGTLDNGTTADGGTWVTPTPQPGGAVVLGRNWGTLVVGLVVAAMVHL